MAFLHLNLRLRCHSKIILTQLEIQLEIKMSSYKLNFKNKKAPVGAFDPV